MTPLGGAGGFLWVRRHDFRLVPAAAITWASVLLGLLWGWQACLVVATIGALAALAALAALWHWRGSRAGPGAQRRWPAAAALLVCAVGAGGPVAGRLFSAEHDPLRPLAMRGLDAAVRVTVAERPRPLRTAGFAARQGGVRSVLVPVELRTAHVRGRPVPSTGRAVLIAPFAEWSRLLPGQDVTGRGSLAPARPAELTVAVVYVRGPPGFVGPAPWWQRAAEAVRAGLREVCSVLPDEPAGLLPGLVVGDTSALPSRVEDEFRDAGMSHLTAVSGTNVAIVCGAVLLIARLLRRGPRGSAVVAGAVLAGYVVLVGYEPSVLRAGVMGAIGLLALVLGRRGSAVPALAAAVCVLVLQDPQLAVSFGFTLSVAATAGLVLLAPSWSASLVRRGVPTGLAEGLAVPLVAFLVTAPLIAGIAGVVSLVSVAANVLAAPVVAPVTVLGVLAAVLAQAWSGGAEVLVHVAGPGVSWLVLVAREAAALPGAVVPWPGGWAGGLLAVVVVGAVVLAMRYRHARIALALVLVGLLVVFVPTRVIAPPWPPEGWAIVACDVGQGDGLVLATGEPGEAVVVDTGPEPGPLDRCLDRLDVERVPLVVLSHLHADHIGGLGSVFEGRAVGGVAVGPGRTPGWAWQQVGTEAAEHRVPLLQLTAGRRLDWPGLRIEVLGPRYVPAPDDEDDGTDINNTSVVLRAATPAGKVLLTGDIELSAQADLLAARSDLRAEILKVPHHGSRFSLPQFLGAVAPRIALVSVGADNTYGHPNATTLGILTRAGTLVARTDTSGDTAVVADGDAPAIVRRGRSP